MRFKVYPITFLQIVYTVYFTYKQFKHLAILCYIMDPSQFTVDHNSPNVSLHNNLLSNVSIARSTTFAPQKSCFSTVKPEITCTNQKSSGRCWIFAGLNMLRRRIIEKLGLPNNFQFSQSHLFFYDKLERMNYNIVLLRKWIDAGKTKDSREVQHLLKEPFGDGGQWAMFANLIDKYGVMPQYAYPESFHSSNSRGVNTALDRLFRNFANKMLTYPMERFNKKDALQKTYTMLVSFFGEPPKEFLWEYKKKDGSVVKQLLTPQKYATDVAEIAMSDYVSLTHDPRNDLMQIYGVQDLGNVEGGSEVKYLNISVERMRALVRKCVDNNQSVWFGSDVGQFLKSKDGVIDQSHFNYIDVLGIEDTMSKKDRIEMCESLMTHAMVFDGYHLDAYGTVDYWLIENSWGTDTPYKGHLVCSDDWFREYTYQLVVPKSFLKDDEADAWNNRGFAKRFPLWDPMGSLAK